MAPSYHLMLGGRDWRAPLESAAAGLGWDARRGQVTLRSELLRFPASASERPYGPGDRRGGAADRFGNIFWIGDDRSAIHYQPAGSPSSGLFWSVEQLDAPVHCRSEGAFGPAPGPPPARPSLRGLGATGRGYLVAGTLAPAGLLVFDLHGGGPPRWHRWPGPVELAPFDMAAAPDGGLWILDRRDDGSARLWYLDCALRVAAPPGSDGLEIEPSVVEEFRPLGELPRTRPARFFSEGLPLELASPAEEAAPVSVAALPDGTLLVLDLGAAGDRALVHRLRCGEPLGDPADLNAILLELLPGQPSFTGHDLAFLADSRQAPGALTGVLYVASHEGNQSFAFALTVEGERWTVEALTRYLPMRRFAGKALIAGAGDVFYDQRDRWLPLTELPRPRYVTEGWVEGLVFDGKEPACVWHRLFIDGCIPAGDAIEIESRAADDEDELEGMPWGREPALFLRKINRRSLPDDGGSGIRHVDESELPSQRPFASGELAHGGVGTWELLFQRAVGRFLELRITLRGSGRSTPKIRSLRVHYPRLSYRDRFLPVAYREDAVAASFLDRLLANFEGFYTELEQRVGALEVLFDSRTAPSEALEWLASWLGAALDEDWEESRRRLFIAHAFELYRQRGTPRGLGRAIRLAIEACPDDSLFSDAGERAPFTVRISEHFRTRPLASSHMLPGALALLPGRVSSDAAWDPAQGGARLHRLYQAFLIRRYGGGDESAALATVNRLWGAEHAAFAEIRFSPLPPPGGAARDWRRFLDRDLRLPYADVEAADVERYRSFLRSSYVDVATLNRAHGLAGSQRYGSFEQIALPAADRLPADGAALADWFQFATVDLPLRRNAHRFSVLVPVRPEQRPAERQALRQRAAAVVEREKPSHTQFDVQLYWALFRVGGARVGLDTLVGEGSRFTALVLGAGYVGEGLLEQPHPWNVTDRFVTGRDSVGPVTLG